MNSRQTAILRAISAHTGPVSLQELLDSIVDVGSRRTLQRELGNLCKSGLLERIGQTRVTAYALTDQGRDTLRDQRARYQPIDTPLRLRSLPLSVKIQKTRIKRHQPRNDSHCEIKFGDLNRNGSRSATAASFLMRMSPMPGLTYQKSSAKNSTL